MAVELMKDLLDALPQITGSGIPYCRQDVALEVALGSEVLKENLFQGECCLAFLLFWRASILRKCAKNLLSRFAR